MKYNYILSLNKNWSLFLFLVFLILGRIENISNKSQKSNLKKLNQNDDDVTHVTRYAKVNTNDNTQVSITEAHVKAKGCITIPDDSPILKNFKTPKYVQGLYAFSDSPHIDTSAEVISINKPDNNYYKPFDSQYSKEYIKAVSSSVTQCDYMTSPVSCKESALCTWDSQNNSCLFLSQLNSNK